MGFLDWIVKLDQQLFTLINRDGAIPDLDFIFMLLRNAFVWIPLYLFVMIYIIRKFRRQAIPFIVISIVAFGIADYTNSKLLKPAFGRLRPCHDPELSLIARDLVGCGGQYSFPSSHAVNHFGLATFWFLAIRFLSKKKWYWLFVWAILIGYSQIYVGKHYVFDIVAGAIYGGLIGIIAFKIFEYWCLKTNLSAINKV